MLRLNFLFIIFLILISCSSNQFYLKYNNVYLEKLLVISKKSILEQLENKKYKNFINPVYSKDQIGIAVRIVKKGNIEMGCIAFINGASPLEKYSGITAINAAFFDKRFKPIDKNDLNDIFLEISIFDKFKKMKNYNDFELGKDSVLINNYLSNAIIQAQIVIEEKDTKDNYLKRICLKAGMDENEYKKENVVFYKAKTVFLRKKFSDINIKS